jgi:hypothetical protein
MGDYGFIAYFHRYLHYHNQVFDEQIHERLSAAKYHGRRVGEWNLG